MKNVKIQRNGIVIICGPNISGKSGIARKILNEYQNSMFIWDEDILKRVDPNANKEHFKTQALFIQELYSRVKKGLDGQRAIVISAPLITNAEMASIIAFIRGQKSDARIKILKIYLPYETQLKYWMQQQSGRQYSLKAVKRQREVFSKEVLSTNYSSFLFGIDEEVLEETHVSFQVC